MDYEKLGEDAFGALPDDARNTLSKETFMVGFMSGVKAGLRERRKEIEEAAERETSLIAELQHLHGVIDDLSGEN